MRADSAHPAQGAETGRRGVWRQAFKRFSVTAFFVLFAAFFVKFARTVDWAAVAQALRAYPTTTLAAAACLAALSHLLYSSFDLIGRLRTGHGLGVARVCAITFVSYAFNLNLGSLVGGFATRYRLYTRDGLTAGTVTRVLMLSIVTNWLGYAFLGGLVLALSPPSLSASWAIGSVALRTIGAVLLACSLAYVAACAAWKGRVWTIRGRQFELPSASIALWQLAVSSVNWAVIASIIHVLLKQQLPYPTVLSVLLVAAVAGVITHVPAGLGVLEAVFLAALSGVLGHAEIIAALLAYRAVYYLLPLVVASALFAALEATKAGGGLRVGLARQPLQDSVPFAISKPARTKPRPAGVNQSRT